MIRAEYECLTPPELGEKKEDTKKFPKSENTLIYIVFLK